MFLKLEKYFFQTDPNDGPTTPRPHVTKPPVDVLIDESTDEETDEDDNEDDILMDENPNPEDMVANDPIPIDNTMAFNPQDRHISYEDCNLIERARLMQEIQNAERAANNIVCSTNTNYNNYETYARNMRELQLNREGKYTSKGLLQLAKDRKSQKQYMKNRHAQLLERLRVARRYQFFLTQQFQAVLNGILYRTQHPNQAFVIYIRYEDVVLQHTNHPNNIFSDIRLTTVAPANKPKPAPRRKPREDRRRQRHRYRQLPGCNAPLTRFDQVALTEIGLDVVQANDVIEYLGLASMNTKIIKINYLQQAEIRLEEQWTAVNDLFNVFSWTMEGYFTSSYYHQLYEPAYEEMKKINSLFEKVGLDVNKKLPVAQYLRGHFLSELQKDIKWYWHPSAAIADTIKILKIASAKLLL